MEKSSRTARHGLNPRSLGIMVAIVGVLACAVPGLFLIPGFGALPVVAVWAWVYGIARDAPGRWPWWVMGQWLSLCVVFVVTLLLLGVGTPTLWVAPWVATIMTAVWMVPVALIVGHRQSWATKRPEEARAETFEAPTIDPTKTPRSD